ncbi:MAG: lipoate--protein ligase family protein [Chloroflexi bacterium]|nr:lipoate--protein ligase family protein [Chloroflexota bacterium]
MSAFPAATWRLLRTPPASGAWNMAVDEAILETTARGESLPTLRLYAWQPPCLSLGYAQPFSNVDAERAALRGWEIVRRATGGRAILHTDELTYSVAGPQAEPRLAGAVLDAYQRIAQALLAALHGLGVPAAAHKKPAAPVLPASMEAVCFEVPSNYEIVVAGKKLLGSAQSRRQSGVLQHGSLPLYGDLTRITQALAYPDEAARSHAAQRLTARAATVEEILGYPLPWETAAHAFIAAFSQALDLTLLPADLTPAEESRAAQLLAAKYASPAWTQRV